VIRSARKRVGDPVEQGETLATVESNESLQTYAVSSPLKGVITARSANPGEQASDKPLFTVADLSSVWVELSLFPRDVAKVRVGQLVRVKSTGDTQLTGEGKVVYVAPFGTASSQTLIARVALDNTNRKWPPGLYVSAEVTLGTKNVPLAIANSALQTLEQESVVFVKSEHGFEPRPIQLGKSDGDLTEVTAGLHAGESYATRNIFILKAELAKGEAEHEH
jgi:cobalt-zinc-cadmium efflux system membrane fusion protein